MAWFGVVVVALCMLSPQLVLGDGEVFLVSQSSGLCLSVGSDGHTMQYLACSDSPQRVGLQKWKMIEKVNGYEIQSISGKGCLDAVQSNNGGVAQVWGCDSSNKAQVFQFGSDGKMKSSTNNLCLDKYSNGEVGDMMKFKDCGTSEKFAVSSNLPGQTSSTDNGPPSLDSNGGGSGPKAPPVAPGVENHGYVIKPPMAPATPAAPVAPVAPVSGVQNHGEVIRPPQTDSVDQEKLKKLVEVLSTPTEKDHYLCVCVVDTDNDKCTQAVKSACAVGHIPVEDCLASFDRGDHEKISSHVVNLIDHGARCSKFDPESLKKEAPVLPTKEFKGQNIVTSEDHYLCVCLKSGGASADEACVDAVKTACVVGHIPQVDCDISFDKGQEKVVQHVLRLIDNGANCANKLVDKPTASCPQPPCYGDEKDKGLVTAKDHYLCPCIDDPNSQMCLEGVREACKLGHMPQEDCLVAKKGNYLTGVTRHALVLVEHGAKCSAHTGMKFTNNRCHCKQKWKTKRGVTMEYPNNCADPEHEKGFPWCETYEEEGCTGVSGSLQWDRCDSPRHPVRNIKQRMQGQQGKITEADHYLCICIDSNANNEICLAAAKAACSLGHIPANACRESFENNDHEKVTNEVLKLIQNGAKCKNVERDYSQISDASDNSLPKQAKHASAVCGHGTEKSNGGCSCFKGYEGEECNRCAPGFIDYPDCAEKRTCNPGCVNGLCNFITGKCVCPQNFVGESCDQCAPGLTGKECLPGNVTSSAFTSIVWFVKHTVLLGLFVAGIVGLCMLYQKKCKKQHDNRGYYAQVPGGNEGLTASLNTSGGFFGSKNDAENPEEGGVSLSQPGQPGDTPFRTGLAI